MKDRSSEETKLRELVIILQCLGSTASQAPPAELAQHSSVMLGRFLAPSLQEMVGAGLESRVTQETWLRTFSVTVRVSPLSSPADWRLI